MNLGSKKLDDTTAPLGPSDIGVRPTLLSWFPLMRTLCMNLHGPGCDRSVQKQLAGGVVLARGPPVTFGKVVRTAR